MRHKYYGSLYPRENYSLHFKDVYKSLFYFTAIGNYASRVLEILLLFLELSPSAIHQSSTPINVSAILQDVENIPVGSEEQEDDMTNVSAARLMFILQYGLSLSSQMKI